MFKKINLLLLVMFFMLGLSARAEDLKINGEKAWQGESTNLFYDDLEGGKINFSVSEEKLKKAEVTFDKGRNWLEMKSDGDSFSYGYRPLSDEVINPEFILTSESGSIRTIHPNITIRYQKKKPDQAIDQLFEKMKTFYENEDINNFINLFSMSFPDRVKFREAIQNDFYNYKNMRLFYRTDQRIFDDDSQGAVCSVYWERRGDSRTGTGFSDSAIMSMRLDKEGSSWLISGLRNNTIFGSSLIGTTTSSTSQPDLSVTGTDLVKVGTYDIKLTVHNTGNAVANNVKVDFYYKTFAGAYALLGTKTISTIAANSSDSATQDYSSRGPGALDIRAVVDPLNTISESSETNNTADANIILG